MLCSILSLPPLSESKAGKREKGREEIICKKTRWRHPDLKIYKQADGQQIKETRCTIENLKKKSTGEDWYLINYIPGFLWHDNLKKFWYAAQFIKIYKYKHYIKFYSVDWLLLWVKNILVWSLRYDPTQHPISTWWTPRWGDVGCCCPA